MIDIEVLCSGSLYSRKLEICHPGSTAILMIALKIALTSFIFILLIQFADNVQQTSAVPVYVQVLNINDHAPEFSEYYDTYVCENAGSGQVRTYDKLLMSKHCHILYLITFATIPPILK